MRPDEAKAALEAAGISIVSEDRLGNDSGVQLKCDNGAIVNCFDTGAHNVQGKNQAAVKAALDNGRVASKPVAAAAPARSTAWTPKPVKNKVFVVYGHDESARNQLEAMLRRWKLEPLILDQLPSEGQTIIEKLEKYTAEVNFAVVLATPDDEGHRANRQDEKAYRARQNVVLELGMLLARLGRKNVAILLKQQENMERPSDIQGLIYVAFKDDLQREAGPLLAKEMTAQGYEISVADL
ncbi:TPA: nucleotide-binding protein [Burkholderia vietnamiensis]|nr:nucleotide-binding protein [Burkholderia vietnamiensis]